MDLVDAAQPARARKPDDGAAVGWLLADVTDPFALEVHRPVQPDIPQQDLPELPAYVPREHDTALAQMVTAAADGSSRIAVLVGESSTGKTRACWEALGLLRNQKPQWRLWHPIDPSRPDAVLRGLPAVGPRTVIWLNEAQFYLDAPGGLGEQVAAGLRELLRDRARQPVLVLATLWPSFWDALTSRRDTGDDPHSQARELLAGQAITVPGAFTAPQLRQLTQAGDLRLAQAARTAPDGQVIQFLAGVPELLARYRNAPAATALIHAAMDARRMGMSRSLPRAFLKAAAPAYLSDSEWDLLSDGWLEQALTYTATPCRGVRGPLTRIRPLPAVAARHDSGQSTGPDYLLADYLDQYGRSARREQFPPAAFWAAAARCANAGDLGPLGNAARDRGLFRAAAQLEITVLADRAATATTLDDAHNAGLLLRALRKASAEDQAEALIDRFPGAGLFEVFAMQQGRRERFRFGREADGCPAAQWDWEDLE